MSKLHTCDAEGNYVESTTLHKMYGVYLDAGLVALFQGLSRAEEFVEDDEQWTEGVYVVREVQIAIDIRDFKS